MKPLPILLALAVTLQAAPPEPKFRAVTLDDKIQIGYGLAIADVDGDKQPDILLADKKQFVWYRNPGASKAGEATAWTKFVLAENLTKNDNVCIAAQDIDGDGKCEVAVGAEWNPGDTVNSGAVFYLIPPADRTQKWEPVKFPSVEPTTHRMKWVRLEDDVGAARGAPQWGLVVAPLHGRGNKDGGGTPVKLIRYHKPADPRSEWKAEVIDQSMHMTHNFDTNLPYAQPALVVAGKEGFAGFIQQPGGIWMPRTLAAIAASAHAAGEVRFGFLYGSTFVATVEPMHGNALVLYYPYKESGRRVHTENLTEGHALACGDLLGMKSDQIVVGWRGTPGKEGSTFGVHIWTPLDEKGEQWRDSAVDDTGMACEDLQIADLDGDGKLDIIAAGRATKNVKIYFNETPR